MPPWLLWVSFLFASLFGILYIYVTWNYGYWKKRGIPYKEPSFPFGNFRNFMTMKVSVMDFYKDLYGDFKGQRYAGSLSLSEVILLIRDPELIKGIFVKDFSHFHDRGLVVDEENDPMSANLFNLNGSRWHALRNKLSPVFTSGKMKYMFSIIKECAIQLQKTVERESERSGNDIESKDMLARYTTDIIGSAAFGVEPGALENPNAEFRVIGRRIFEGTFLNAIRNLFAIFAPRLGLKLGIKSIDPVSSDYFSKIVSETITYREKNNVKRSDFLQLLIGLNNETHETNGKNESETALSMNQLTAQCLLFFLGGFETSATTLTFCLYELSQNLNLQQKLRDEVDRVLKEHGEITYDGLAEMHFMDKVISETLRKYPAVPVLFRECTKEYTIPAADKTESNENNWEHETRNGGHVVEMGTKVHIPISGLHYDPKYFPDPERFDPERFSEEAKKNRPNFAYLPFGEGPRICIGMRFGNMQTKAGLAALLSKFEFRPSPKTPKPLLFDPNSFVPAVKNGIWIRTLRRRDMQITS